MAKKNQSNRLTSQHKQSQGVVGIFGEQAKSHDLTVGKISKLVMNAGLKAYFDSNKRNCEWKCKSLTSSFTHIRRKVAPIEKLMKKLVIN